MKANGVMLVLLVLVLALGFFLVAVNLGNAGDQPLILAQRAAPAVPPVAAPAPEMEQRQPAASAPSPRVTVPPPTPRPAVPAAPPPAPRVSAPPPAAAPRAVSAPASGATPAAPPKQPQVDDTHKEKIYHPERMAPPPAKQAAPTVERTRPIPAELGAPGVRRPGETAPPQLAVRGLGLSSTRPSVGERVFATARIQNSGTATVKGVTVRFFAGDRQVGERSIDLPPGNSEAGVTFIPDSSGALQVKVTLDRGFETATRTLKVQGEGRELAKAKTEPERPGSGESDKGAVPPQRLPFDRPDAAAPSYIPKGTDSKQPIGTDSKHQDAGPGGVRDFGIPKPGPKKPDLDSPFGGGSGGPDRGDGIEGIHDQGDMPKTDLGKDIPDPRQGPGQKTTGHGYGKGKYGEPLFKTPGGHDNGYKVGNAIFMSHVQRYYGGAKHDPKIDPVGVKFSGNPDKGTSSLTFEYANGNSDTYYLNKDGNIAGSISVETKKKAGGSYPREDGEGKVTASPKTVFTDPLLIMKWIKAGPTEGPRGDPLVSDPVPVKGGKAASGPEGGASPAKGGELVGAGAGKAEAKWRFSGRKPGSGVTDPAEWQDRKIRDFSFARMKGFEVIDPVEAPGLKNVLSKAQAGVAAGAGAPSVTITSVAGAVQKLAVQDGKQGWAPLKAGDSIGPGAVVRIDTGTGGEVGVGKDIKQVLQQSWTKVYSSQSHAVYLLQQNK